MFRIFVQDRTVYENVYQRVKVGKGAIFRGVNYSSDFQSIHCHNLEL